MRAKKTLQNMLDLFEGTQLGENERAYLLTHAARCITLCDWMARKEAMQGLQVLDVGCGNILLNAVLLASEGAKVTALDSAEALRNEEVARLAEKGGISLIGDSLEVPQALLNMPEDAYDVLLLAEVLEHLTFNPVEMWRQLLRVLRPGGRVYVTTPNYHGMTSKYVGLFYRDVKNVLCGRSSGLRVERLLTKHTCSPHWKEYSARDLQAYFGLLSADLRLRHLFGVFTCMKQDGGVVYRMTNGAGLLPTRAPSLMLTLCLEQKRGLVQVAPSW